MGFKGLAGNCLPLESISKLSLFMDFLAKSGKINKNSGKINKLNSFCKIETPMRQILDQPVVLLQFQCYMEP